MDPFDACQQALAALATLHLSNHVDNTSMQSSQNSASCINMLIYLSENVKQKCLSNISSKIQHTHTHKFCFTFSSIAIVDHERSRYFLANSMSRVLSACVHLS
jgi:hypothetical protein